VISAATTQFLGTTDLHCVHEKTITQDNVRQKCQIWTHPNKIACAWLWIYLRQKCQIS